MLQLNFQWNMLMHAEIVKPATLYLVATPIGNLAEWSPRAQSILSQVDVLLCEDTRHSARLLKHFNLRCRCVPFHQHNAHSQQANVLKALSNGASYALISDAGMPLISDPGHGLVQACHHANITVVPVSGACAVISAVAASGWCHNGFIFTGFLPEKASLRQAFISRMMHHQEAWVFFEAPHRMLRMANDLQSLLLPQRKIWVGRELTKRYEETVVMPVEDFVRAVTNGQFQKGEMVMVLSPFEKVISELTPQIRSVIQQMIKDHPAKVVSQWVFELTGVAKNQIYEYICSQKNQ